MPDEPTKPVENVEGAVSREIEGTVVGVNTRDTEEPTDSERKETVVDTEGLANPERVGEVQKPETMTEASKIDSEVVNDSTSINDSIIAPKTTGDVLVVGTEESADSERMAPSESIETPVANPEVPSPEPINPEPINSESPLVTNHSVLVTSPEVTNHYSLDPKKNAAALAFISYMGRTKETLALANKKRKEKMMKRVYRVMDLFKKKKKIKNDDVEKFIHTDDSTATKYLNILAKENKIKREGNSHSPYYTKVE